MLIYSKQLNKEVNAEYICDHEMLNGYIYVKIEGDTNWSIISTRQIIK